MQHLSVSKVALQVLWCLLARQTQRQQLLYTIRVKYSSDTASIAAKTKLQVAYQLLNLSPECTAADARLAFLSLAKKYHPDVKVDTANAEKFAQIEEAYRNVQEDLQKRGQESSEDYVYEDQINQSQDIDFGIKHTVPQHRHYLSFEGIGYGTPSQRQRQYQQSKVMKASERVHDYRVEKISAKYESAVIVKERKITRKIKTSSAIDRLVEDLIQESMARGDFDNLPGKGKPIKYRSENPYVDTTTHNLNQMLINNGYIPEWISMDKDIRQNISKARAKIAWAKHELDSLPSSVSRKQWWKKHLEEFRHAFRDINKEINKLNMIVPSMNQQMIPYNIEKTLQQTLDDPEKYMTGYNYLKTDMAEPVILQQVDSHQPDTSFRDAFSSLWGELKALLVKKS